MSEKIKIYTTGGSIDKGYDLKTSRFLVGPPEAPNVLREANVALEFEVQEFIRKDSLQISEEERLQLKQLIKVDPAKRIIVTHGTDTMALTGQILSGIRKKVIVLTGAMQPAAFRRSDAQFNLGTALMAVQLLPDGVYLVMNGKVFNPFEVKKDLRKRSFVESSGS